MVQEEDESWHTELGESAEYTWDKPFFVQNSRLVIDSNLSRPEKNIIALRRLDTPRYRLPATMVKKFRLDYRNATGEWQELATMDNVRNRLINLPIQRECTGLRLTILESYGEPEVRVFAWDFN